MAHIYTMDEIRDTLRPVFRQYGVRKAVLFGSYAKGLATARSDVDLLVDSGLKGLSFFGLLDEVSGTLQLPVDLIDVCQVENGSPVDLEIRRSGVEIYAQ